MSSSNWARNRLLLALPSRDLKRLMSELEHIRCRREQVLMDADSSLDHVQPNLFRAARQDGRRLSDRMGFVIRIFGGADVAC